MSAITNKNAQGEGLRIGSQTPVDDRVVFTDLTDLQDLGAGDSNAYRYYEGMRAWVLSTEREYVWKESATGELPSSFTYPAGLTVNGISYGGRDFNFVETGTVSLSVVASTHIVTSVSLVASTPYVVNVPGAADIISVSVYTATGENITDGINIELTAVDDITLTSLDSLANLSVKATYIL